MRLFKRNYKKAGAKKIEKLSKLLREAIGSCLIKAELTSVKVEMAKEEDDIIYYTIEFGFDWKDKNHTVRICLDDINLVNTKEFIRGLIYGKVVEAIKNI